MSERLFADDVIFLQRLLKSSGLYKGKIDGDWGPKTDAAVNAFEEKSETLALTHGIFDSRTEGNIQVLHLKAQEAARKFMNAVLSAGINARIISGTRTYAQQNVLFAKGRFGNPPPIVTKARGGGSNHNFCIAWDIGIFTQTGKYLGESPLYTKAGEIALAAGIPGLEWGGNWITFVDPPHFQLKTGLPLKTVREKFEIGQPYI